jgi:hypothetical protein
MPFSVNGCGTKYYGKREKDVDGSYVTTEWITLIHLPLIPIGSFRVQPTGRSSALFVYQSSQYYVTRVPLNWRQIRNIYLGIVGAVVVPFGGLFLIMQMFPPADGLLNHR